MPDDWTTERFLAFALSLGTWRAWTPPPFRSSAKDSPGWPRIRPHRAAL